MKIQAVSTNSIIIYFCDTINEKCASKIKSYFDIFRMLDGIIDIVPSYTSILVTYDIFIYDFNTLKDKILNINITTNDTTSRTIINIPVHYNKDVGLDLDRVSKIANLSIKEVIKLHAQEVYTVYAIGFAPGFAYMANVNKQININRLDTPRKQTPKNSVAIANNQTAIYPQKSPGGWNIIGRTPLEMFDKTLKNLSPLEVGYKVKFNSISKNEFLNLGGIL
jgi:KipI family sensor histidine kinase inhibitor